MSKSNSNKRNSRGYRDRDVETRLPRERFLIVCEGERTEPNYFLNFRVPKEVLDVQGLGFNTVSLVKKAIELKRLGEYTQVWCVFDRDSFPPENFNNALSLAKQRGIRVAYSNEAFELWYLLHFHFFNSAITREDYKDKLSKLMGKKYEKKSPTMFDELLERQSTAIENARRLLIVYEFNNPLKDNPSTTVHLLVEELRKHSKK